MNPPEGSTGIARYEAAIRAVFPPPNLTPEQCLGQAMCGGGPEPSPPFTQPDRANARRAIDVLRRLLTEGKIGIRWYWAGWARIIWQQGSSADLYEYQQTCGLLPGGWEPQKDQFKSVDSVRKLVWHSSYAALLGSTYYPDGEDVAFLVEFRQDYAPGDYGWASPKPWKDMPMKATAINAPIPRQSWMAWIWGLFGGRGGKKENG